MRRRSLRKGCPALPKHHHPLPDLLAASSRNDLLSEYAM